MKSEQDKALDNLMAWQQEFDKQEPVAWIDYIEDSNLYDLNVSGRGVPLYTAPRELSDEQLNKAFDYYCETDEGVLRFNLELRDEWKKEQLARWKEAFKKASEKC